ncbi:MAG: hypothetical protein GC159_18325 [Phycisphaera sp.]|nr:hypothetical protein [Phycisphaera sp.]
MPRITVAIATLVALLCVHTLATAADVDTLPGTAPLTVEGDFASQMVDGIDRFLLRQIAASVDGRAAYWKRDTSSPAAYEKSIEPNRRRLATILGVVDLRMPFDAPELVATTDQPALVARGDGFDVYAIRWPVLSDPQPDRKLVSVHGEGLLLVPTGREPVADVVAIPHCDQTPEQIVGLTPGVAPASQFARRLAEAGCRVVVPVLINREDCIKDLTHREYIYRAAYMVGRQLTGYEVQKTLAIVDWFKRTAPDRKVGVIGYGDGGMLALYAAALDTRIDAVGVSGSFGPREAMWSEPIDRNTHGLLREFGDAELMTMIPPRSLVIEIAPHAERDWPGGRGAPAKIVTPNEDAVKAEIERAAAVTKKVLPSTAWLTIRKRNDEAAPDSPGMTRTLHSFARQLSANADLPRDTAAPKWLAKPLDIAARHARQFHEIDRHNQALLRESINVRNAYIKPLVDSAKQGVGAYEKTAAVYREKFYNEVIGRFDIERKPFNARSRKVAESDKWTRYEVMLDVWDDVFTYGLLIVPKGMKAGERRPVVVCQHGLEGRPIDCVEGDHRAYHDFATKLAERGYITFAPQNPYIFKDRFRTLQRKAQPLGRSLFSVIIPQHQQIVDWLKSRPEVDGDRIGFYGLSYGGKTAMRVPAVVTGYALSICSGDFNEWVWKNAATDTFAKRYTYANKGEYEIFEWNLGQTFNYAEMAMLIAPRPFMVERGHADGVAPDETVAWEFARVRRVYEEALGFTDDRCAIEWFNGPHTIHGVGTFEFLDRWLKMKQ